MTVSTIGGIKLYDLPDRQPMLDRCPEEIAAIAARFASSGLGGRNAVKSAVIFNARKEGDTAAVLTHPDEHPEMQSRNSDFSKYQVFPLRAGVDLAPVLSAMDRLSVMDLRRRRMKRAGLWKTGSRHPARFWMCDTVMRRLLDRYEVEPNALQWALGNAREMTIGIEHEKIGLKPVDRQGALLLHCDYGVRSRTRKTLPGRLHRFRMGASADRVTKFMLPLSDTVTFRAEDERHIDIAGELMPETLMMSLVGQRAYDVVRHELLDVPDAIITHGSWIAGSTRLHLAYGHAFVGDPR